MNYPKACCVQVITATTSVLLPISSPSQEQLSLFSRSVSTLGNEKNHEFATMAPLYCTCMSGIHCNYIDYDHRPQRALVFKY